MQPILLKTYQAEDVNHAIQIVNELKLSENVNLFRGQSKCWPLCSSLTRISGQNRKDAHVRISRFAEWIIENKILADEPNLKDHLWAIAQHYGLPTTLIDFTYNSDVAFFFATSKKTKKEESCVYCISKETLDESLQNFKTKLANVDFRILEIDVKNLWRLQSQNGLFINFPLEGLIFWEDFVPFHKITFPNTSVYKSPIPKKTIYPNRKSSLELKLDQHFRQEEIQSGLKNAITNGVELIYIPWESNRYIFKSGVYPPIDTNWEKFKKEAEWSIPKNEHYFEAIQSITLSITNNFEGSDYASLSHFFKLIILEELEKNSGIRSKSIKFEINTNNFQWTNEYLKALELFWDGIRQYPYTDIEISESFGNLASLLFSSIYRKENYIEYVFGETYTIEFQISYFLHSRVCLPKQPFIEALNLNLFEHLNSELYPIKEPFDIINHIHETNLLFDFNEFKNLFVRYIIPCQVIYNFDSTGYYSDNKRRSMVIFSPFEISKIRPATAIFSFEERIRNKERIVSLHPALTNDELIYIMAATMRNIEKGRRPIMITLSSFESTQKALYDIPKAIKFCGRLLEIGFISILEMTTMFEEVPEAYNPYALGAFEIWLIATKKMKHEIPNAGHLFKKFYTEIHSYNEICDHHIKEIKEMDQEKLKNIFQKGIFGQI